MSSNPSSRSSYSYLPAATSNITSYLLILHI
nr:MAG TPA: hypothetical protein [Caudoviricetes sp.]